MKPEDRPKIKIVDKVVQKDGVPIPEDLPAPEPIDLFPEKVEMEKWEKIRLSGSDVINVHDSTFQAFAAKTSQTIEVHRAYRRVRSLHPSATHVIAAANLKGFQGYQDDGEHGAGHKLYKMLANTYEPGITVFVVRVFGRRKIGSDRFSAIEEVAREAAERAKAKPKTNH